MACMILVGTPIKRVFQAWQPAQIPAYLQPLTNAAISNGCSCQTRLGGQCQDGAPNCINGLGFDPHRFLHTVALGSVIERDLRGVNAHPYHQHVYPFQLVDNVDDLTGTSADYFRLGDWHDGKCNDSPKLAFSFNQDKMYLTRFYSFTRPSTYHLQLS